VATALQTTVYNAGIAAGSLTGGLVLGRAGPAGLPWVTLAFGAAALGIVTVARRAAFPAVRPGSPAAAQRDQHTRPLDEAGPGTINTYCR
jgi:hypothetical protein